MPRKKEVEFLRDIEYFRSIAYSMLPYACVLLKKQWISLILF